MKILYFAWLRQKIGAGEEDVSPPPSVDSVVAAIVVMRVLANAAYARLAARHRSAQHGA